MSKISISCSEPCSNAKAIKLVRKVTGISLKSIKERLAKGKSGVFYTTELFLNDNDIRDREIRELVSGFSKLGIELFVAEIAYNEDWNDILDLDSARISETALINILDSTRS